MDSMGGIITKGLGADCTAMIIGYFRLKLDVTITPIPQSGGGHGSSVTDFTPVYYPDRTNNDDERNELDALQNVKITVKFDNKQLISREYVMPLNRASKVVVVINSINRALSRMQIGLTQNIVVNMIRDVTAKFNKKIDANVKQPGKDD